ncbi:superoxide dismutase [Fe] [Cyclospora cayetanensis]|uniref:Superoxide dismutase [Fe] n=1 Tax=Cyclospora cayetanensis TaxID=88456 RepID=A0A6P6RWP3_9EIME|nr:superoxide dismutase [Fe] [Cyclospora cayetanensis]
MAREQPTHSHFAAAAAAADEVSPPDTLAAPPAGGHHPHHPAPAAAASAAAAPDAAAPAAAAPAAAPRGQLLWGFMSLQQLAYHYARHHAGYVKALNSFAEENPKLHGISLEEAVQLLGSDSPGSNACGQHFNHTFFFATLPGEAHAQKPLRKTAKFLQNSFGSHEAFERKFKTAATGHVGSGWVWLAVGIDGGAEIVETHDCISLLSERPDLTPLIVIDVWEHAYYLDYKNARAAYVDGFLRAIDWAVVEKRLAQAENRRRRSGKAPDPPSQDLSARGSPS